MDHTSVRDAPTNFFPVKIYETVVQPRSQCAGRKKNSTDIDGNKMDFGVSVFTGFGGGHVDDLAGAAWGGEWVCVVVTRRTRTESETLTLDDDVAVLAKGRALHGEGVRGPGRGL